MLCTNFLLNQKFSNIQFGIQKPNQTKEETCSRHQALHIIVYILFFFSLYFLLLTFFGFPPRVIFLFLLLSWSKANQANNRSIFNWLFQSLIHHFPVFILTIFFYSFFYELIAPETMICLHNFNGLFFLFFSLFCVSLFFAISCNTWPENVISSILFTHVPCVFLFCARKNYTMDDDNRYLYTKH